MANSVDERVVKMTFDNKKFESNVKTTMSTLDKLKEKLSFKGASKGFDELNSASKRVDLSHTANEIENVKVKFSSLQVVGATVMANLTTSAMQAGSRIFSALTNSLVQGGINRAMNIEQAKFQLNGLGVAWEEVSDDINYAVDGTAYGLDVAAKAASQLTASGIQAGDAMKASLRGISGVAAMTNSTYEDISRIFTSIAGQNRVMGNDLLQLSGRGINAAATLGKYLNKSEAEVRAMVSKGQIDFATFSKAMDDAFGEHAKDANKTFTGALSNMKAALARIGAEVATPALDNLRDIFNALRVTINDIKTDLGPFISKLNDVQNAATKAFVEFVDLGGLKAAIEGVGNIFRGLWSVIRPIQQGFASIFPTPSVQQVVDMANKFRDLTAKLYLSEEAANSIRNTFSKVAELFKRFLDAAKWGSDSIHNFLVDTHILSDGMHNVSNAILDFILGITNGIDISVALNGIVDGLSESFSIFGRVLSVISSIISVITSAFTNAISGMNQAIANLTEGVGTGLQGAVDIVFKILEIIPDGIAKIISAVGNGIKTILNAIPIHEINSVIQDSMVSMILVQISRMITGMNEKKNQLNGFFDDFKGIIESVKGVLDGVKGSIQSFTMSIRAKALLKIAMAIGLLAVSLRILADVPIEQLGLSLAVLATGLVIMGAAIVVISKALKKVSNGANDILGLNDATVQLIKVAAAMVLFALAVKILSSAMSTLSDMSWGDIVKGLVGISGMAAVLIAASKLMGSSKGLIKASVGLIVFSYAVKSMAESMKSMENITWEGIAKGLFTLSTMILLIVSAAKILDKNTVSLIKFAVSLKILSLALRGLGQAVSEFDNVEMGSVGKSMLMVAGLMATIGLVSHLKVNLRNVISQILVMMAVVNTLKHLADLARQFDEINTDSIKKFVISMIAFFGALKLFINTMTNKEIGKFLEISGGMWGIAEAIRVFANGVKDFAGMKTEEIAKGLIAIVVGLQVMVRSLDTMPDKKILSSSSAFLVMAVALNSLAKSITTFANMDFKDLAQGLLAVVVVMGIFTKTFNSLHVSGKKMLASAASVLVLSIAISALVGPIKTLGNMNTQDLAKGLIALAASMAIIGIAARSLGNMTASILKMSGSLVVLGASIIVLGLGLTAIIYPLKSLGEMGSDQIASGVAGLAAILGSLYALTNAMNTLPSISLKTIAKLAIMSIVIAGVGAILGKLSTIDAMAALESATAISMVLLSASGALAILALAPLPAAVTAVITLGVVIAGISAIVAAMGGIAQIPGVQWIVSEGAAFMRSIGEAIGGFFGGIAGGAINAVGAALPALGQNLARFSAAATPFFIAMENVDSNALDGVKALSEMILMLTAANVLNSLTSWLTGGVDLSGFAKQLVPFGQAIQEYASVVAGLDADAIKTSAEAGKALGELAESLPATGGIFQDFMGEHNMVKFANQLVPFGEALQEYSRSVKGLDASSIQKSAEAAKALTDLVESLPESGGLAQDFLGSHDMVAFTEQLVPFGQALSEYSVSVGEIDSDAIYASANGAKAISELINSLPETGGLAQQFTGEKSMSGLIEDLVPFGEALASYSSSIDGIDPSVIESSAIASKALSSLLNDMPETGGLIQQITGVHDMTPLVENLADFGTAMKDYSESVSGINPDAISASAIAGKSLVELVESFPKTGGGLNNFDAFFNGTSDASSLTDNLVDFGTAMKDYSDAIDGIDSDAINASATAGKAFAELLNALPKENGWAQYLVGTSMSLGSLSDVLVPFGEAMKAYSDSIDGLNSDAVSSSATAGQALAELYKSLPKQGGALGYLDSCLNGISNMDTFKDDMVAFGDALKAYSNSIDGINPDAVSASATAGQALADLANNLPKDGGFFSVFDGKTMDMDTFGNNLVSFGQSMSDYYDKIEDLDSSAVTASVDLGKGLAEIAKSVSTDDGNRLGEFSNNLPLLGTNLNLFRQRVIGFDAELVQSVTNCIDAIIDVCHKIPESLDYNALSQFSQTLIDTAYDSISGFATTISDNTYQITDSITSMMNCAMDAVSSMTDTVNISFQTAAETSVSYYNTGIENKRDDVITSVNKMVQACLRELNNRRVLEKFENAGKNGVLGYAKGFSNNDHYAATAARVMATKAMKAVRKATEVRSPSKAYYRLSRYNVLGYALGYEKNSHIAENSAKEMANNVMFAFSSTIDRAASIAEDNLNFSPTITPVIDLSNAENQAQKLNSLFTGNYVMPVDKIMVKAQSAIANQNGSSVKVDKVENVGSDAPNINFTQNNYSPKALSRVDIYRQTRNQISMAKEVLRRK